MEICHIEKRKKEIKDEDETVFVWMMEQCQSTQLHVCDDNNRHKAMTTIHRAFEKVNKNTKTERATM